MRTSLALTTMLTLGCITTPPPYDAEQPSGVPTPGGSKTLLVRAPPTPMAERIEGDSIQGTDFGRGSSSWFAGGRSPSVEPTAAVVRDPETNLLLPQGWMRVIERKRDTQTIVYHERAPEDAMSLLGMSLITPDGAATSQALVGRMSARLEGAIVMRQVPGPQGILFIELQGSRRGTARKLGLLLRSAQGRQAVAFFEAPTQRYNALGGASLLFAFASGAPPQQVQPEVPKAPQEPLIAEREVQRTLLSVRTPTPVRALLGTWYEGMDFPKSDMTNQTIEGLSALGQGNVITFTRSGTYTWLHRYDHSYQSCTNEVESVERGTFEVAGGRVTLRPLRFEARMCPCCKGNPRPVTRRPTERVLEIGMHAGGRHMALRGACPAHMVRCEAQDDTRTLWLGLTRAP